MKSYSEYKINPASEDIAISSIIDYMSLVFDSSLHESIINGSLKSIDEAKFVNNINNLISKAGFHVKKNKGLIGHLINAGKGVSKLFIALINKDADSAKQILRNLKKEDILDFLLDLDMATLHIVSGPIHLIDAITGWHLWANVKEKVKGASIAVMDAIKKLKQYLSAIVDKTKVKIYSRFITNLEKDLKASSL